jgi:hypothetical protein
MGMSKRQDKLELVDFGLLTRASFTCVEHEGFGVSYKESMKTNDTNITRVER